MYHPAFALGALLDPRLFTKRSLIPVSDRIDAEQLFKKMGKIPGATAASGLLATFKVNESLVYLQILYLCYI